MFTKLKILFWIGIVLLFLPFIGITSSMKTVLTIAFGALVVWIAIRMRRQYKELRFRLRKFEEPTNTMDAEIHLS